MGMSGVFVLIASFFGGGAKAEEWNVPRVGQFLSFPLDHGSHPDFKIEWWYLTGHLFSDERRFGFQATFFRIGQEPINVEKGDNFGTSQMYLAHMGLSDPATGVFLHEERLNRGGWDAGAKIGDLDIYNGNWSLRRTESRETGSVLELEASIQADSALSLKLIPQKGHVIFGDDGISRKGPEGTAASYYITFPRLAARGILKMAGETFEVEGEAWMDHEISSSQLARNQIGWDWTCIQLFDGREIMAYVLRTEEGPPSAYSKLTWIAKDGVLTQHRYGEYEWLHEGRWTSDKTKATYPVSPVIVTTDPQTNESRRLRLVPLMQAQEMVGGVGGISYWEGACDVRDEATGEIVGRAFLEMTGYADKIAEKLR